MSKILGVNERWYPSEDNPDDPPVSRTVLVEEDIGDYAAYTGHGSIQFVAAHGDKISFEEACAHFPGGQLKRELYRD